MDAVSDSISGTSVGDPLDAEPLTAAEQTARRARWMEKLCTLPSEWDQLTKSRSATLGGLPLLLLLLASLNLM